MPAPSDDLPWMLAFGDGWKEVKEAYAGDWRRWEQDETAEKNRLDPPIGASPLEANLAQLRRELEARGKPRRGHRDPPADWFS